MVQKKFNDQFAEEILKAIAPMKYCSKLITQHKYTKHLE